MSLVITRNSQVTLTFEPPFVFACIIYNESMVLSSQSVIIMDCTTMICSVLASLLIVLASHESEAHMWRRQTDDNPGTTPNIADIFQGRCYEHLQCLQTDRCVPRLVLGIFLGEWFKINLTLFKSHNFVASG